MDTNKKSKPHKSKAVCVRLYPSEYRRLQRESEESSRSIPDILRDSYFSLPPRRVLMDQKSLAFLRGDLNKIGNNLNQIARKMNAGLMEGWSKALNEVSDQLEGLRDQIYYGYNVPRRRI